MAEIQTWGMLPKAQDDSTTIDHAITAAVAAHNDDPDAHTVAGQALDLHRVNEVLDHPQSSVVPDKLSSVGLMFYPVFESLSGYTVDGSHVSSDISLLNFTASSPTVEFQDVHCGTTALGLALDFTKEIVFQFALQLSVWTNTRVYGVLGTSPDAEQTLGIGFRFQSGAAVAYIGYLDAADEFHEVTSAISGITLSAQNFYRVHVVPADGVVNFYVNSVLKATLLFPVDRGFDAQSNALFSLSLQPTSSVAFTAYFTQFYYGRLP